jgi:DnaK suppressor protein
MTSGELQKTVEGLRSQERDLRAEAEASKEGTAPVELDQARLGRLSRMDEMQQQAMALELNRRRDIQLQRIEGALQRIESGTYGLCLTCHDAIEPKRLTFDPTVFLCLECAQRAEKRR